MREMRVQSLGREDPLEKEMATHSSILAWRIPWTEEPGGLLTMGLQRVRHDWHDLAAAAAVNYLKKEKHKKIHAQPSKCTALISGIVRINKNSCFQAGLVILQKVPEKEITVLRGYLCFWSCSRMIQNSTLWHKWNRHDPCVQFYIFQS